MARTANRTSKSQLIRNYHASNPDATAREIQDALKEQGVKVTSPLVYNVLSREMKGRKVKRSKAVNGRSNGDSISFEALLEAKKLVASVGSIDEAKRALNTLAKLT
jgi:Fe2+ or Zn2+ uptake regulation protein